MLSGCEPCDLHDPPIAHASYVRYVLHVQVQASFEGSRRPMSLKGTHRTFAKFARSEYHTQLAKIEFRRNLRSHSWSVFYFFTVSTDPGKFFVTVDTGPTADDLDDLHDAAHASWVRHLLDIRDPGQYPISRQIQDLLHLDLDYLRHVDDLDNLDRASRSSRS